MSAADALALKYELLRQKKLAKKKELEGGGGSVGGTAISGGGVSSAISSGGGADGSEANSAGAHSIATAGVEQKFVSKSQSFTDRGKRKAEDEPATVSVAELDRSIIAAVQASTGSARSKPAFSQGSSSQEPASKRARIKLPNVEKRQGKLSGEDGVGTKDQREDVGIHGIDGIAGAGTEMPTTTKNQGGDHGGVQKRVPKTGGDGKINGFLPKVYEALERVLAEVGLPKEQVENKLLSALQEMDEQEALRVFDQFVSGDMARIRNKGAYLWGIVRNVNSGSGRSKGATPFGADDDSAASGVDGGMKMLWPEEEQVMAEADLHEGRLLEKEFKFDNHTCSLPPAESLFSDEAYVQSELANTLANLNNLRSKVSGFDTAEWQRHLLSTSLTGRLPGHIKSKCRPEMLSHSWLKSFELFCAYSLVPSTIQPEGSLRSLHLCESGSNVSALNHFVKTHHAGVAWEWTAHNFSFNPSGKDGCESKPAGNVERFIKDTQEHWLAGASNSLDLRDREKIEEIWQLAKDKTCFQLVTADGHLDGEGSESADAERIMAQLVLSQIVAALGVLAPGGSLLLRAGTLFEHSSLGILYLLNGTFTEVVVARPCSASSCECEVFVVCTGFKGVGQAHLERLLQSVGTVSYAKDGAEMAMMPKSFLSPAWLGQFRSCNELFARLQSCMIEREMRLFNKHLLQAEKQEIYHMRDKAVLHWQVRFGCRQLNSVHDRITRDGLSAGSMSSSQASAGGRIWQSLRGRFALA